jgi:hypothetical protein
MKIVIIILLALFPIGFSYQHKSTEPIYIIPSEDGFEIYDSNNEILLEFTHANTDSLSLETLKYIHEVLSERSEIDKDNKYLFTGLN